MQRDEFKAIVKRSFARVLRAAGATALVLALIAAYARFIEPTWLCVRHIKLSDTPTIRILHVSDIHFKGDAQYLEKVVATINRIDADMVCFTGDLIEDAAFLKEALHLLAKVNKPMYGVPGNHDQWALRSFDGIRDTFRSTGGAWLADNTILLPSKRAAIMTVASRHNRTPTGYKRILLEHYPSGVDQIRDLRFNLILAGHTHGGQIAIPFMHKYSKPLDLGDYDRGLFQSPCGPLYVNPGIGTFYLNMRFCCRPEIALIEL